VPIAAVRGCSRGRERGGRADGVRSSGPPRCPLIGSLERERRQTSAAAANAATRRRTREDAGKQAGRLASRQEGRKAGRQASKQEGRQGPATRGGSVRAAYSAVRALLRVDDITSRPEAPWPQRPAKNLEESARGLTLQHTASRAIVLPRFRPARLCGPETAVGRTPPWRAHGRSPRARPPRSPTACSRPSSPSPRRPAPRRSVRRMASPSRASSSPLRASAATVRVRGAHGRHTADGSAKYSRGGRPGVAVHA